MFRRFLRDEAGLELSEYAVMAGLVVLTIVAAITYLAGSIASQFSEVASIIER